MVIDATKLPKAAAARNDPPAAMAQAKQPDPLPTTRHNEASAVLVSQLFQAPAHSFRDDAAIIFAHLIQHNQTVEPSPGAFKGAQYLLFRRGRQRHAVLDVQVVQL